MKAENFILLHLIIVNVWIFVAADDSQCTINGRKAAHIVDERFIGVSLDPAFLFSGIKISSVSVNLAKHLSPTYIRFAGPSTAFLKYTDDSKAVTRITEGSKSLAFGPTMWWSLNAWIKNANFTPVFALNTNDDDGGKWDPKSSLTLLDFTAKMNVECYWQLGYDCEGKSEEHYVEDLKGLRHVLDSFPSMKRSWKTVGSDLGRCFGSKHAEIPRKFMEELEGLDVVMWEPENEVSDVFGEDPMHKFLSSYQPGASVWTTAPKVEHPIGFKDALDWAIRLGETAKNGFGVIFRQPRFQELFADTPVYWVTLLHKTLMGRNVLDVKTSSLSTSDTHIYAHCSNNQNSYSIRGAMTIMIINNGSTEHTTAMKVAGTQLKNVDVRSYMLTSEKSNSGETYLNEERLSINNLTDDSLNLRPKLRRAKAITHLTLTVPPKSIGFFVLPGARIPICIEEEDETSQILEEINRDQNIDFGDIFSAEILSRIGSKKESSSLSDLYHMIEQEMEQDEKFYKKIKKRPFINPDDWRKSLSDTMKHQKSLMETVKQQKSRMEAPAQPKETKSLITDFSDVKKLLDKTMNFKNLLAPIDIDKKPKMDVDMSSSEILRLLTDRAKAKVEKKVGLASSDLDEIIERTFRNKIRTKREARGGHGKGGGRKRPKRDINMNLLNEKADKKGFFRVPQKEATIRKPGQTSDELLEDAYEPAKAEALPTKIFAGLAAQEDDALASPGLPMRPGKESSIFSGFSGLSGLPKKDLFGFDAPSGFPKLGFSGLPFAGKPLGTTSKPAARAKTFVGYVKEDAPGEDVENLGEGDLNGYHGFHEMFGDAVSVAKPMKINGNRELWEFGGLGSSTDSSDLLQNEFVINNAEGKGEIEKTIQRLEEFFNTPKDKPNTADYESGFGRFKREHPKFALGDIDHISDNIDDLKPRLERRRRSDKEEIRGTHIGAPKASRKNKKVNIPDTPGLDKKKYEQQIKFLKRRLAHRKKLERAPNTHGLSKPKQLHAGDLQRKLKEHFELTNRLRKARSAKNTYDIRYDEVYIPKVTLPQIRAYESKLAKITQWKPEDILKLPQIDAQKEIPVLGNSLRGINKRLARHVNGDINSVENTIDDFLNAIQKDTGFIKPLLDKESGEYAIILPTKDSISLMQKNGDAKLKIHEQNKGKERNEVDLYTCPASDFSTKAPTHIPNTITINDDLGDAALSSDDDVSEPGMQLNSTLVQSVHNKNGTDTTISVKKIVNTVNHLVRDLYQKFKVIFN